MHFVGDPLNIGNYRTRTVVRVVKEVRDLRRTGWWFFFGVSESLDPHRHFCLVFVMGCLSCRFSILSVRVDQWTVRRCLLLLVPVERSPSLGCTSGYWTKKIPDWRNSHIESGDTGLGPETRKSWPHSQKCRLCKR